MKTLLLTTVALAALGLAPAVAADLAPRSYAKAPALATPLPNWAGFYIGLNGGGAWSKNCWDLVTLAGGATPAVSEGCHNATGGVVGGQVGYRWQASNWVFGLEAQGDWADLKASNVSTVPVFAGVATNQTKTDAIGLFTGQVGYAWDNVLWYVKGGAAVTHNTYTGLATVSGFGFDSAGETRWGGAVGTGVEFGFAPNWSVAVEYDHLFMGRHDSIMTVTGSTSSDRSDSIKQDVDMATVRVNYRFGGPVIGKY